MLNPLLIKILTYAFINKTNTALQAIEIHKFNFEFHSKIMTT